jgi:hypothetical protein
VHLHHQQRLHRIQVQRTILKVLQACEPACSTSTSSERSSNDYDTFVDDPAVAKSLTAQRSYPPLAHFNMAQQHDHYCYNYDTMDCYRLDALYYPNSFSECSVGPCFSSSIQYKTPSSMPFPHDDINLTPYERSLPDTAPETSCHDSFMQHLPDHAFPLVAMPTSIEKPPSLTLNDFHLTPLRPKNNTSPIPMPRSPLQFLGDEQHNEQDPPTQFSNGRFQCRYNCGISFVQRRNKARHEIFHCRSREKTLVMRCKFGQCTKTFRRPDALTKHMTGVHKICTLCTEKGLMTFKTSDEVRKHKLVSHNVPLRKGSGSGTSDTCSSTGSSGVD